MKLSASIPFRALAAGLAVCLMWPSASAQYTYGKYLEPPTGYVIQGIGNWTDDNGPYLESVEGLADHVRPGHAQVFLNPTVSDSPPLTIHAQPLTVQGVLNLLVTIDRLGCIPQICISFYDTNADPDHPPSTDHLFVLEGENDPMHTQIRHIGEALAIFGKPAYCRIGGEFNNQFFAEDHDHAYHAYDFPECFRQTHDILVDAGAHCAFIWCWYAGAPPDYMAIGTGDHAGQALWYPGGEYIDWFGLDIYLQNEFIPVVTPWSIITHICDSFLTNHYDAVSDFLDLADDLGFPVFVETSSVDVYPDGIVDGSPGASAAISQWFAPFIEFVEDHPVIKALDYVSHNWDTGEGGGACWRNGTLNDNAAVLDYWLYYLTNSTTPAMLGKNSEFQLNGYYDHYWSSLGNSMAGTSGAPVLVGGTPIVQDGEVTLKLSNAAHPATAVLVIGMTAWYHRSVGGTQVPYPDISLPQATGTGSFEFTLPFLWPENADPLYFQFWVPDAGGPSGWAASNALEGATIH